MEYYRNFAQAYGEGSYGQSAYQSTTSSGTTANGGGGSLSNTGIAVAGIVTLAAIILLAALVVRIWRRPGRQTAAETAQDSIQPDDGQVAADSPDLTR